METVLSIQNLTKHFGRIKAVNELSFDVPAGSVYGILGPNGSGKTTTLGMVLDVVRPTSGTYQWFGQDGSKEMRQKVGAILEAPLFYPYLSAVQNLKIVGEIKRCGYDNIDNVLNQVELFERRNDPVKHFSLGMKQRMAIAAALLPNPNVLLLDEPTNGLDPQGIAWTREFIRNIAAQGTTIILASHLLDEVEKVCTHVAVLQKGVKKFSGEVGEVLGKQGAKTIAVGAKDHAALKAALEKYPDITDIQDHGNHFVVTGPEHLDATNLNQYLFGAGVVIAHLNVRKNTLEQQFLQLLEAQSPQPPAPPRPQ